MMLAVVVAVFVVLFTARTLGKRPVTGGADLAKPWAKTIFAHLHPTPATIKNQPELEKYFQDAHPNTTL
jgi:hypothetical protein